MSTLAKIIAAANIGGKITAERTGNFWGITSTEFLVKYPNGHADTFWSGHFHNMSREMERLGALMTGLAKYERRQLHYIQMFPKTFDKK